MIKDLRQRVAAILDCLGQGAYEREETIALALLSALAGESIFLLGLPGVGKSMVARRLKMAFRGATSFEYLMSRFSTPDEIFGPVSISKLKDSDSYERVVSGYLPTSDIVFLDEIWKAGPAIQNALLTVLNERIFRNGSVDLQLPLKAVISASNELPAEGEGLEALWDRFLIRYVVQPIQSRNYFLSLLFEKPISCHLDSSLAFTADELTEISCLSQEVKVPIQVGDLICEIRSALSLADADKEDTDEDSSIPYVSDRRWRKIVGILRVAALLNGRQVVDLSDCLLLEHMIWDHDAQIPTVRKMVAKAIAMQLQNGVREHGLEIMESSDDLTQPVGELVSPDNMHYVFTAGNEDILIKKSDYAKLSNEKTFINITSDGHVVLSSSKAPFYAQKQKEGTIIINSIMYSLHRKNALKAGSVNSLVDQILEVSNSRADNMDVMISNNLFLRMPTDYTELIEAKKDMVKKIVGLKYE